MDSPISAKMIRTHLGEIINEVYYRGREFVVERKGKPMVKIVRFENKEADGATLEKLYMKFAGRLDGKSAAYMKTSIAKMRGYPPRGIAPL